MASSEFQNSGSFRRNLNLREQNGSENKVMDQMSIYDSQCASECLKIPPYDAQALTLSSTSTSLSHQNVTYSWDAR